MIILLSPAKTINFDNREYTDLLNPPRLSTKTNKLVQVLKKKKVKDLKEMMKISDHLAEENVERYATFSEEFTVKNSRAALFAFAGDVYQGLDAWSMNDDAVLIASQQIRILSGLYGLLKPMDMMQPYRLEMGSKLKTTKGTNLYQFWGDEITTLINLDLKESSGEQFILNLASNEYFKAVNKKKIKAPIINVDFREERDEQLKFISYNAKRARGRMARYVIDHQIENIEQVKSFDYDGYSFMEELSTESNFMFVK
jgi:hypothetical protein